MGREGRNNRGTDEKTCIGKREDLQRDDDGSRTREKTREGEQGRLKIAIWLTKRKWKGIEVQRYPGGMYLERLTRKLITAQWDRTAVGDNTERRITYFTYSVHLSQTQSMYRGRPNSFTTSSTDRTMLMAQLLAQSIIFFLVIIIIIIYHRRHHLFPGSRPWLHSEVPTRSPQTHSSPTDQTATECIVASGFTVKARAPG